MLSGQDRYTLFLKFKNSLAAEELDKHRNKIICDQLKKPGAVYDIHFLIEALARLMKVPSDEISSNKNLFETTFLQFIRKLNPEQVPFLTENTTILKGEFSLYFDRVDFFFRDFNKDQIINMARVIEQFFPGSKTTVMPHVSNSNLFWFSIDKAVFLQQVLPVLFEVLEKPQRQEKFQEPEIKETEIINPLIVEDSLLENFYTPHRPG